jgi:hypothetical protein
MENAPETKITAWKASQLQATLLQDLAYDSSFNPKQHKDMLDRYSQDFDADVAAAAKALLEKAPSGTRAPFPRRARRSR